MKKIISFYIFIFVLIFLIFSGFFSMKLWELNFIESKKKEIKYITYNILELLRSNISGNFSNIDRAYLLYLFSNLPDYVYFIVYDQNYNILFYYPTFFEVDYDFLKKQEFGKENLVIEDYILTYFLPFNRYMLSVEMDLKIVKDVRNLLGKSYFFIILFSIPFSYLLSVIIFKLIDKRINIIREFVFNVSLGKFDYDINYVYNDELKDIFMKVKIMKEFLIKYINEIQQNKKILEELFNNFPFYVIIINDKCDIVYINKNLNNDLKELFYENLVKSEVIEEVIKYNKQYFKMIVLRDNTNKIGIFVDITDFYNLSEIKDRALAMISHDLRTPIASIKSNLEFLLTKDLQNDIKSKIAAVLSELDKINKMIYRYLDYSRIKLGKKVVNFKLIKIIDFINFINDFINFVEYSNNIEFDIDKIWEKLKNQLAEKHILIDLDLFYQLMSNLLDNAYKYSLDKKVFVDLNFDEFRIYLKIGNSCDMDNYNLVKSIILGNNEEYLAKGKFGLVIAKELANLLKINIDIDYQVDSSDYGMLLFILGINYE